MEEFLRIKVRYNTPVVWLLVIVFAPIAIIVGQFSRTGAAIVIIVAVVLGWLLELGTPPLYELIAMVITSIVPVGLPTHNLVVDGKTGEVELAIPGIYSKGGTK